jgi:hypothetical protein
MVHRTVGEAQGHWARRRNHIVFTSLIPVLYYVVGDILDRRNLLIKKEFFAFAFFWILVYNEYKRFQRPLEARLKFAMRLHEATQISAETWGGCSCWIVMLAAPKYRQQCSIELMKWQEQAYIALPLIWTLAFVDPLLGEMRKPDGVLSQWIPSRQVVEIIGSIAVSLVWTLTGFVLGGVFVDWWFVLLIGPTTVAAERPKLTFIDDNAMMLLIPLIFVFLFQPFFSSPKI